MKHLLLSLVLLFQFHGICQDKKITEKEIAVNGLIKGTLFTPEKISKSTPLVILIAGSGPTNRSGNQIGGTNNSLKYLSQGLAQNGIGVFSYDKRIFAQMAAGTIKEGELSFSDFINDAKDVLAYFKTSKEFSKIIIAGHSEGSLIGMVAANDGNADGFISIAGPGRPIDEVLAWQLEKQLPQMKAEIDGYFAILRKGETFELKNQMLSSIFRESVQPYMISWIKYNPQQEIAKLKVPVLLINGTKDLQVTISEAELLKKAKPDAQLQLIPDMNHIFKEVKGDDAENMATYNNPDLPIANELTATIVQFIKSLQ